MVEWEVAGGKEAVGVKGGAEVEVALVDPAERTWELTAFVGTLLRRSVAVVQPFFGTYGGSAFVAAHFQDLWRWQWEILTLPPTEDFGRGRSDNR